MASTNNLNGDSGILDGWSPVGDDQRPHNGNESTTYVNVGNVIKLTESSVKGCANIGYGRLFQYFNVDKTLEILKVLN